MRIIDNKWLDLSNGYQAVQNLQARLEKEFSRAVQVGYRQKYRRELTEWQKKRRVFFLLLALAPLPVIALCVTSFYYREVSCVLAWWLVTVLLVLGTLVVAGWGYITEMIAGRPVPQRARVATSLPERWFGRLSPQTLPIKTRRERGEVDFLTLLFNSLPDDWLVVRDLFTSPANHGDTDILLLGPSGLWIFEVRHWDGTVIKQDGIWKKLHKKHMETVTEQAPDEQWNQQRENITRTIHERLPHLTWIREQIYGGIVFSHPKVHLEKSRIQGNSAPYGMTNAWLERIRQGAADERFNLEIKLEILDALINAASQVEGRTLEYSSSREEADRLYQEVAGLLHEYVSRIVE